MERLNLGRTIGAGFVATVVMTILMYAAPMMGMPKMDIAAMLGSVLGGWWIGMIVHFINGTIIFPLIYAYLLYPILRGQPWLRGLTWGLILWFLAQIVVMPMMGMGAFSTKAPEPGMTVMGSLIGHIIYGVLLGAIAGAHVARGAQPAEERRVA